jgi:hypothetical protein
MAESTIVVDAPAPAPTEVLIPEARHRQRQRYRRSAILVSIAALLAAALVALLITTTSGGSGTARGPSKPSALAAGRATVLIRPVLCLAPPYVASRLEGGPLPSCAAPYEMSTAGLDVTPTKSPQGFSLHNVASDPGLAGYPTATRDTVDRVVLLAGLRPQNGGERYLLGPSDLRLSAANVTSAVVRQNQTGSWVVDIHLAPAAAAVWDRVAQQNFHQMLAIDMGGKVVTAALIQPTQASFTSFDGAMEVSGNVTAANARAVVAAVKG